MFLSPCCTSSALSPIAKMNMFTWFSSVLLTKSDAQQHHSNLLIFFGQSFGLAKSKFSIAGIWENAISLIPLLAPSSINSTRMIIPTEVYNQSQKLIVLNTCTVIYNPFINSQYIRTESIAMVNRCSGLYRLQNHYILSTTLNRKALLCGLCILYIYYICYVMTQVLYQVYNHCS